MKAITIIGKGSNICRKIINTDTMKVSEKWFEDRIAGDYDRSVETRIHALRALNDVLGILQNKNIDEPIIIFNLDLIQNVIENGLAIRWFSNGGKKNDGSDISKTELDLWEQFYGLYESNLRRVIFKSSAGPKAAIENRKSKYPVSSDIKIIAKSIADTWEEVNKKSVQDLETIEDEFADVI